jgi:hypothetical protein
MAESTVGERLEQIKNLLGSKPDHELAQEVGTQASVVARYRRSLGIPAGSQNASGTAPKRRGRKPGRPAKSDSTTRARKGRGGPRGPKRSKLDSFRSVIGKIPDKEVAARAGMSVEGVRLYRKRNDIALEPGARLKRGRRPKSQSADGATQTTRQSGQKRVRGSSAGQGGPRRRISKLDPYRDMLGKFPDREVADKAGVTAENVRAYRRRHSIPATWREDDEGTSPPPKRGRGRPPGVAPRHATRPGRVGTGQQGYSIHVVVGTTTHEYMIIAADISSAAESAQATIRSRHPNGEITAIRHLGPALG